MGTVSHLAFGWRHVLMSAPTIICWSLPGSHLVPLQMLTSCGSGSTGSHWATRGLPRRVNDYYLLLTLPFCYSFIANSVGKVKPLPKVRTCSQIAAISLAVGLLLEVAQLLTGLGSFDVDDLILNVAGGVLGWLVYLLVRT